MSHQANALAEMEDTVRCQPQLKVIVNESAVLKQEKINNLVLKYRENGRKLARSLLRKWNVRIAGDEIDSIVDVALCEAASRYREDRGASFMTFLYYHLRGHLVRLVANAAQLHSVFLAVADLARADIKDWCPSPEDIVHWISPELADRRYNDSENPENLVLKKEEFERCRTAMTQLDSLEQEVVVRSYLGQESLVDIAKALGYSRCHISRVKKRALERLQDLVDQKEAKKEQQSEKPSKAFTLRVSAASRNQNRPRRRGRRRSIQQSNVSRNYLAKTA